MKEILLTSSVLILALLLLRRLFQTKISRRFQYALWGLVLLRLLIPVNLPAISKNVLTAAEPVMQNMESLYVTPAQDTLSRPDQMFIVEAVDAPRVTVGPATENNVQISLDRFDVIHQTTYEHQINLADLLRPVWYGGIAVMACWLLLSNLLFWQKLRKVRTPYPAEACKYPVYLVESGLPSPCLFGLFRPAVYLTPAALASPAALRHVLAHEETHARHLDPLWSLLRSVCLAVYWFDPLVWWAAAASRTDCELACDEDALRRLGEKERIPYGRTLLSLIPVRKTPANPMLSATTMTADKKQLKDRITRIAQNYKTVKAAFAAVALLAAVVCAVTFTEASGAKKMSGEEAREFMDAFFETEDEDGFSPSFFCNVLFSTPHDINLYELFYYGTGLKNEEVSQEEHDLVLEQMGGDSSGDYLVKITTSQMNAYLTKYTGYPLSNRAIALDRFIYLPDYDAYYHFISTDSHSPEMSFSNCTGLRQGNTVQIRYDGYVSRGIQQISGRFCFTFKKIWSNRYFLYSHWLEGANQTENVSRSLTAEELAFFNEDFFKQPYKTQFLTSLYDQPEDIDLFQLLYNGTDIPETITEDERQRVINVGYGGTDPKLDLTKITYDHMTRFLRENTGYSGENPGVGLEKFTWLGTYNAYYHFHGDTNTEPVTFTAGTRDGDLIHLYYDGTVSHGEDVLFDSLHLTLQERSGGGYWFVSNQLAESLPTAYPSWEPELVIPLDDAQPYTAPAVELKTYGGRYVEMLDGADTGIDTYALCAMRTEHGNVHFAVQSILLSSWPSKYFLEASSGTYAIEHFRSLFGHDGLSINYEASGRTLTDYYYFQENGTPVLLVRIENAYMPTCIDLDGNGEKELASGAGDDCKVYFQRDGQIYQLDLLTVVSNAWTKAKHIHFGSFDTSARCVSLYAQVPFEGTHDPTGTLDGTAFRFLYFDGENLRLYKDQQPYPNHFAQNIHVSTDVQEAAKQMVAERIESESEGWRLVNGDFVTMPVQFDGWRVSLLEGPYNSNFYGQTFQVWRIDYQLHTNTPEYVITAGGRYVTDDGWVSPGYPGCDWLIFHLAEDGSRKYLYSTMANDCTPDSETFWMDEFPTLEGLGLLSMDQLDGPMLLNLLARDPAGFLNDLAERPEAQRETVLQSLAEFAAILNEDNDGWETAAHLQWENVINYLRDHGQSQVTEEGKALWDQLNRLVLQNLAEPSDAPASTREIPANT
ncbi:MAG: M56 family metallopeptidase [Oscillibacter sp.]|nr:M56 family metallopeptidase [Oscillibacter sp.]